MIGMTESSSTPATSEQICRVAALTKVALRDGFTRQELQTVHANGGAYEDAYLAFLRQFIQQFRQSQSQSFPVVVDYAKSLAEMVKVGKYDWVNPDITDDHFPLSGKGQRPVEVVLFRFIGRISSSEAIGEMDRDGFRPANPAELLALGSAQPDLQRQFPIVALGQIWWNSNDKCNVVALFERDVGRVLRLEWFTGGWDVYWRFAAVSK